MASASTAAERGSRDEARDTGGLIRRAPSARSRTRVLARATIGPTATLEALPSRSPPRLEHVLLRPLAADLSGSPEPRTPAQGHAYDARDPSHVPHRRFNRRVRRRRYARRRRCRPKCHHEVAIDATDTRPEESGETTDDISEVYAQLSAVVAREQQEVGAPGVAVAVVEDGRVAFAAGFGVVAIGGSEPVRPTTRFRIGSVTKLFTALGVMRLVDQGLIGLDTPVTQIIPELALTRSADRLPLVTVRHLLTHSAGLPEEPTQWTWSDEETAGLEAYMTSTTFTDRYSIMAPPGAVFSYSTLGMDLAGLVIERASGRAFADFMQSEVFDALDIVGATFDAGRVESEGDYASGTRDAEVVTPFWPAPEWQAPGGLAFASVLDLAQLARFLMDGDESVLSAELHRAMVTPAIDTHLYLDRFEVGLGVWVIRGYPRTLGTRWSADQVLDQPVTSLGHAGLMMGCAAEVIVVPERRFAFIVASNDERIFYPQSAAAALELVLDLPEAGPVDAAEAPSELGRYVGSYTTDTGLPVTPLSPELVTVTLDAASSACASRAWVAPCSSRAAR